jgi:hypothetical protein
MSDRFDARTGMRPAEQSKGVPVWPFMLVGMVVWTVVYVAYFSGTVASWFRPGSGRIFAVHFIFIMGVPALVGSVLGWLFGADQQRR